MAYSDLIIWQYQGKPKALETLRLFDRTLATSFADLYALQNVLNIDEAQGVNLDLVGKHVGQSRVINGYQLRQFFGFKDGLNAMPFSRHGQGGGQWYRLRDPLADSVKLGDDDYRFLIKARILKNYQTATLSDISQACRFILGDKFMLADNYDMTVTIKLPKNYLNSFKTFAIKNLDILPRPSGVKFIISTDEPYINPYFAFQGTENAKGFNRGIWKTEQQAQNTGA